MIIRLDPASAVPIFEQLVRAIRSEAMTGRLAPGERLPAARSLAASLDVNVHTVLHAYQALRDQGVLELRRGRGAVVREQPELDDVTGLVAALAAASRSAGLTNDTVMALMREELER